MLRLANPPRNFLGPVLRAELSQTLSDLEHAPDVAGVLLTGSDGLFSTGYNAASPEMREGAPSLAQLCRQIEDMQKPVVAALFGVAHGAGLELALAAHGRVALRSAVVGMPDIAVGLIPSAGGTQRLPRLLGADRALALLLSGLTLPVIHPRVSGLVDEIVTDGVEQAAADRLRQMIAGTLPIMRTRDRRDGLSDPAAFARSIQTCRDALGPDAPPHERLLVDCVERALLLPFDAAEAFEELAFAECQASDHAQGLLHVQLAQRRAHNMPEALAATPQPVGRIAVIGGGATAAALVFHALRAGQPVTWFERSAEASEAALTRLHRLIEASHLDADTRRTLPDKLTQTTDLRDLGQADLVIEAVADNPGTKAQVFEALANVAAGTAILLSHSATLPVAPIADAAGRISTVLGFYCPAGGQSSGLAELVPGPHTSTASVVTAAEALRSIGVQPVRTGSHGGTIGQRMVAALRDAAVYCLSLGAAPAQVDAALVAFGLTGGVFAQIDSLGLDVVLRRAEQLHRPEAYALAHLNHLRAVAGQGRTGRAAGAGVLDWSDGQPVPVDPSAAGPSQDQIVQLCLGAMMNEGARLLREGVALRPSDIDLVMVRHHGFPAWRGGPMNAADRIGLFTLTRQMAVYAEQAPRIFAPDPGIAELIKNGEHLEVLNAIGRNRRRIGG